MKGHIRQRRGKWQVIPDIGRDPVTGRRRQKAQATALRSFDPARYLADLAESIRNREW